MKTSRLYISVPAMGKITAGRQGHIYWFFNIIKSMTEYERNREI